MKVAVYPGSFNPWHEGHQDVLDKALKTFDKVIILRGYNPDKELIHPHDCIPERILEGSSNFEYREHEGLLKNFVEDFKPCAIIKGIRNIQDFEYEKTQQYWNEDLGITVPTFYIITDRKLSHISSSAIRIVDKFKST